MRLRLLTVLLLAACVPPDAPPPTPPNVEEQARQARALFDEIFQAGQYERIPEAQAALKAVYDQDPSANQGDVAMLLGVSYLWSTAEWQRDPARGTDARKEAVLESDKYLSRAKEYRPGDGRVYCWLGIARAFRAQQELDLALYVESIDLITQGVDLFPQFALLVVSFVKSLWPADTTEFASAIEHIWKNVDVCIQGQMDRANPDFTPYLPLTRDTAGNRHACWTTPEVPHNLEGFWFHMGDLLVKNNQPDVAVIAYNNAKVLDSYASWKYRQELESRVARTRENAAAYRDSDQKNDPPMLPQTNFQCTVCHER